MRKADEFHREDAIRNFDWGYELGGPTVTYPYFEWAATGSGTDRPGEDQARIKGLGFIGYERCAPGRVRWLRDATVTAPAGVRPSFH